MKPAPKTIDGAIVVCYSPIDHRHRPTGACTHTAAGIVRSSFSALAIGRYEGEEGFYLFYCDETWCTVTDTWHQTLDDAMRQAEFEYAGVSATWQWNER